MKEDELIPFDDRLICPECLENETTLCACCGQRIWLTDNAGNDNTPLCQTCYDQSYMTCSECGRLIHCEDSYYLDDSDEPLCLTCLEEANRDVIQGYYYKPEPIFYGTGPRYFGVELEIDEGGERGDYASQILSQVNVGFTERLYCKHDGSLGNGFELVTHPMSLEYHQEEMPWPEVLRTARSLGYRSHQTQTCGLHVHVSRKSFGETEEEQEPAIARILYFVEKHWEELLKFSRRTPRQLERWAARYGYKDRPQEILEHAKKGSHAGRYSCVNLENRATIEFRMFRGTLKLNSLLATLQMVDHIEEPVALICNEEGKLNGLPLNRALWDEDGNLYDIISGTFFLCAAPPDAENFQSLSEERLLYYEERFRCPEMFLKVNGKLICLPILSQ